MNQRNYNVVDGFNTIAPAYDLANDAMTFGLHRLWRQSLCKKAIEKTPKGGRLLDIATGTGDVLLGILKQRGDLACTGIDPSEGMLGVARQKFAEKQKIMEKNVELQVADGRSLPFPDNSFDTVTVSWGIRNIKPFVAGLKEALRVLKPGGTLLVLESGKPEVSLVRHFYQCYSKLLPLIGGRLSGYSPAYRYYVDTVDSFPAGSQFVAELFECGFVNAKHKALGGGIVYLYEGQKPKS